MSTLTETAPAKVNLTLRVVGRRQDGYHAIESLVAFCPDLCDVVHLVPGDALGVEVRGPFAEEITGENLISKTLSCLAKSEPRLVLGAVTLEKNLPVAAGIGGGSADAAAVLRAVHRANPDLRDAIDWSAIAASLGADVPVCIESRPAMMWGIGEQMVGLADFPRLPVVLVNPRAAVPADKTAQVFSRHAARPFDGSDRSPDAPGRFVAMEELVAYMKRVGNDLQEAATQIVPEIDTVRTALKVAPGCVHAGLSGAGPTCFGVFESAQYAAAAAAALRKGRPNWWIAAGTLDG